MKLCYIFKCKYSLILVSDILSTNLVFDFIQKFTGNLCLKFFLLSLFLVLFAEIAEKLHAFKMLVTCNKLRECKYYINRESTIVVV